MIQRNKPQTATQPTNPTQYPRPTTSAANSPTTNRNRKQSAPPIAPDTNEQQQTQLKASKTGANRIGGKI